MKSLDLGSLGQITLMSTLIMLIGSAHLGLINGAYIQYAARNRNINRRIVALMATGALILTLISGLAVPILMKFELFTNIFWPGTLGFGLAAGLVTLGSTWLNNALIADGQLVRSNQINLVAILVSMIAALLSTKHGLQAAFLSLLLQPLIVVFGAMLLDTNLRINSLSIDRSTLVLLFRLGLMPFLAGLSLVALQQLERWSIAMILGSESLGKFYIVIMYMTFFGLVPASLANVYFPQAKRAWIDKDLNQLDSLVKNHQRDLGIYVAIAIFTTILVMEPFLYIFLPEFYLHSSLVYYAIPSLIFLTLRNISSMVLFSTTDTQPLLIAGVYTLALFGCGLLYLWNAEIVTIEYILIVRAISSLPGTIYLRNKQQRALKNINAQKISIQHF